MTKTNQVIERLISQTSQVIKWLERWTNIITLFITVIALIVAILSYCNGSIKITNFDGSVKVTNFQETSLCDGLLVDDPLSYLLTNTSLSDKEKEYLESKINCYRDQIQKRSKEAEAYTNIGEAERRLGNLEAARKAHQKALASGGDKHPKSQIPEEFDMFCPRAKY